jgi:TrmH family RNA methyltransferase
MCSALSVAKRTTISRLLRDGVFRKKEGVFVLEHEKAIGELCTSSPQRVQYLVVAEGYIKPIPFSGPIYTVSDFHAVTGLKTSPGILAVVRRPAWDMEAVLKTSQLVVVMDRIQTPANVGAIIRNALAFGVDTIVTLPGTADPYHPEALRAMAGYAHSIPILASTADDIIQHLSSWQWMGLDPASPTSIQHADFSKPLAVVLGSEGQGIGSDFSALPHYATVSIPMTSRTESLNVAVSSGIVLFYLSHGIIAL